MKGAKAMKKVILGKTGLQISYMGFGGIPLQRVTQEEAKEVFKALVEQGVNYLDTARPIRSAKNGLAVPSKACGTSLSWRQSLNKQRRQPWRQILKPAEKFTHVVY